MKKSLFLISCFLLTSAAFSAGDYTPGLTELRECNDWCYEDGAKKIKNCEDNFSSKELKSCLTKVIKEKEMCYQTCQE